MALSGLRRIRKRLPTRGWNASMVRVSRVLGIVHVHQGATNKGGGYKTLLDRLHLAPEQVCCIGDDMPDLVLLRQCGFAVAVADACVEVRATAHWTTRNSGGCGAVRETIELILRAQGIWSTPD